MLQFWFAIGSCCSQVELQVGKALPLFIHMGHCSHQMHFEMGLPQLRAMCKGFSMARLSICNVGKHSQ